MNNKHSRRLRRFHNERKYNLARKVMIQWYTCSLIGYFSHNGWQKPTITHEEFHKRVCKHRDNLAICSCSSCCNPRHCDWTKRYDSLTLQERKEEERFVSEMQAGVEFLHDRKYNE